MRNEERTRHAEVLEALMRDLLKISPTPSSQGAQCIPGADQIIAHKTGSLSVTHVASQKAC